MAVIEVVRSGGVLYPRDYECYTADTKPLVDANGHPLQAGSTCKVLDGVGGTWNFDGTAWQPPVPQQMTITGSLTNVSCVTQDSSSNSPQTLTIASVTGKSIYVTAIEVVISGGSAGNDIKALIKDGSAINWKEVIGSGASSGTRCGWESAIPVKMTAIGDSLTLVIDAGGTGVVTTANIAFGAM
ncbi:hypothetical protein SBF1_50129 [Candidatus Desulfosporosinus infrequens]|uniref:Uncharacterized protein n=1 Tax=Candidatus Desulfosporosinus infrequens TaxID=2043169 RepID=A0A2U3LH31_9FIRM|nr:hypothetical protein SBF1_50129 [Candidatus Desulfosporosinus infrequens]